MTEASAVPAGGARNPAPGRLRVTDRPALRPVSAERGRLRQVAKGNARCGRVSGSAGLELSRCPDASGAARTAVERRKARAPEAQASGDIRVAWRAPHPLVRLVQSALFGAPPPFGEGLRAVAWQSSDAKAHREKEKHCLSFRNCAFWELRQLPNVLGFCLILHASYSTAPDEHDLRR
jgi:hypothetical protein